MCSSDLVMLRTAEEALATVSHTMVEARKCIDMPSVKAQLDMCKGAVQIAYPAFHRLPWYDPVRMECEDKEELDGRSDMQDILDDKESVLWWAGKELQASKAMHEYVGKNEKTKLMTRLQAKGSGAPVRESRVDKETHAAMMHHYYQKQEEEKKLKADDDDSYLESEWANPKALKASLNGGRPISFRGS